MPVIIKIADEGTTKAICEEIFAYFRHTDETFSTYKDDSVISKINQKKLTIDHAPAEVKKVLQLCEETKAATNGYFDIQRDDQIDPSGLVKGYAIFEAANMLAAKDFANFTVEIGGDIEARGANEHDKPWRIGIENPFNRQEIIKVVHLTNRGIATSGTYIRGAHLYDPIKNREANAIASITVIGPNIYEADRFATAAFAMGESGLKFIETRLGPGFAGYMITKDKQAHFTAAFDQYMKAQSWTKLWN